MKKITTEEISALFKGKYTAEETNLSNTFYKEISRLRAEGANIANSDKEFHKLWYNAKNGTKKEHKEWGYWVSEAGYPILRLMKLMGIKNIVDLGCGCGYMLKAMKKVDSKIGIYGFDNEELLIKVAGTRTLKLKDVTTITKKDIPYNSLIYWWEPIRDPEVCKIFVDNVCNIAHKGQIIIAKVAGASGQWLSENNKVEILSKKDNWQIPFLIYRKK